MQPRFSNQRNLAMTLVEVLVIVSVLVLIATMFLPALAKARRKASRIYCVNNLKELGLAYGDWAGNNSNINPMGISVTNGGTMELVQTGDVVSTFQVMSNELSTPKILVCTGDQNSQGDISRTFANNFSELANSNISYFVGVDSTNSMNPQLILSGDSNFEMSGVPVKSGLLELPTNAPISWTTARHKYGGNIGIADGSVWQTDEKSLVQKLQATGLATNRLAIP